MPDLAGVSCSRYVPNADILTCSATNLIWQILVPVKAESLFIQAMEWANLFVWSVNIITAINLVQVNYPWSQNWSYKPFLIWIHSTLKYLSGMRNACDYLQWAVRLPIKLCVINHWFSAFHEFWQSDACQLDRFRLALISYVSPN